MFSPSVSQAPSAGSVRSRRRQRPLSNEGSIVQPKAKRQRSALSEQTFLPPDDTPEMEETKPHKLATTAPKRELSRELPAPRREIAVRGKKSKPGDRGSKDDGSTVLTTNDTYTVSKLLALPDILRSDATARQHGVIHSETGFALALTYTQAIVWPYALNIHSPETFTFTLPQYSKQNSGRLPLGSLVSASASSTEPGLVVVIPQTGKITYWESIASAATLDLIRQQRNGVELTIPGRLNNEEVVDILNAESAGFILSFTSGRLAYMSVRDGQGRPAISVQFLRGNNAPTRGGIFGSIRNVLGASSSHGDIAAVRAGRPDKVGERNVVVATKIGKIQSWNIHRGGHTALLAEAEAREDIVQAIKEALPSLRDVLLESFELIDFTYAPQPASQPGEEQDDGAHLVILISLKGQRLTHYSLVTCILRQNNVGIKRIRPIKSYTAEVNSHAISRPRIYLPDPAVGYIVFDQAVVVLSMAQPPESPDSQLRIESHLLPRYFEDVVDFRGGNVEVVGSGMEEPHGPSNGVEDSKLRRYKAKHPATVLLLRGGGVVRIAATDVKRLESSDAQQVTAKSKLEQAVFFGTLDKNPINFEVRAELQFTPAEIGGAALELSFDILKSQTQYIPATVASIEMNLRKRSAALQHLAEYLKPVTASLDRITRWKLLQNAEKMQAATVIWRTYDTAVRSKPEGHKRGLLTEIVESIHEDYKTNPATESGELDRVRLWFIQDIGSLELAVPWAYQALKDAYQSGQNDHDYVIQMMSEADDVVIGALEAAFDFRAANLDLYGLQDESLEHGVSKTTYEGLEHFEFWTSTLFIAHNVRKQADLLLGLLQGGFLSDSANGTLRVGGDRTEKLRFDAPGLIDLAIRSSTERMRWSSAQKDEGLKAQGEQIRMLQIPAQDQQIRALAANLDLGDNAIGIAEKHEIMPTLAAVIMHEITYYSGEMHRNGIDKRVFENLAERIETLRDQVKRYFDKFGTRWANALYEYNIEEGAMVNLLDNYQEYRVFLSTFLRSKPEYAKVAWIHEVTRERNFNRAAETLLDIGLNREQDLWSKKMELSLGKLARMAGRNYSQSNGIIIPDGGKTELLAAGEELAIIKIQDRVYDHVLPAITDALDDNAELQLALETHGNKHLKRQKTFTALLEDYMGRLVRHESMDTSALIHLLTLMDGNVISQDQNFRDQQFFLALQASRGLPSNTERVQLQRVIWRRCMLRDDWAVVNNTDLKYDQEVNDQLRETALYSTFRACYNAKLFEGSSPLQLFGPQEVAGACTEDLHVRLDRLDGNLREGILKDMRVEDEVLKPLMDTCRLEKWYQSALDLAKQDSADEIDEIAMEKNKMPDMAEKLESIERQIMEREQKSAERALHSRGKIFDTSVGKFRSSTQHHS